ncbi:zinc finger protein Noc-like [Phymastichus coffea]|uniref:zinc finger protein Noc-like n=1 Tax=Phymastichus coffea TaxID=108790 RepID=UPI00273B8054|nr:zinc finger protein Noc-like [Phymastichus coffea]
MVVVEEGSMLTTGPNQYLQPDYLSPLPTTLDAKKSPLALLAQTCSQIGADSPTKPLISSLDKSGKGSSTASSARSPPTAKLERSRNSPSDGGSKSNSTSSSSSSSLSSSSLLAFKPYETNVVSKRSSEESRPASKASSVHSASGVADSASASDDTNNNTHKRSSHRSTPVGRKSASPTQTSPCNSSSSSNSSSGGGGGSSSKSPSGSSSERKTPAQERDKSSASPKNSGGASPIIRSGMEILSGHKDAASMYKPGGLPFAAASALCCPPSVAENPAFRPPFAGAPPFSHHHAAALLGYTAANNPYLNYARVKTASGGETLVPVSVCKDPFCNGCQYSVHNLMGAPAAAACPSGCTQCDHQKYGLMSLSSLGPMAPPALAGYAAPLPAAVAAAAAAAGKPHVCSWVAGDSYCGKRFATSDELLQHLRSHTSLGAEALHPLLSPRGYPAPSLSPLSARYHPYGKPPTAPLPASIAASPYSAFNALGPYYSPYTIYGQRLGAAVHP